MAGSNGEPPLVGIIAEGIKGKIYLSPDIAHESINSNIKLSWRPESRLPENPRDLKTSKYGLSAFCDLFATRQIASLINFSDLIGELIEKNAMPCG